MNSKASQPKLDIGSINKQHQTVVCLGRTFKNDYERRAFFTEELRKKLKDPEFLKIEGFPLGEDEDILALSDPPYYTACPNPWIAEFISDWESQKPPKPADYRYHQEPFVSDVSEGKTDPIYTAHSYHTKVPHKAIMRYILHYTAPGDIVFDGFCGTGMTGVAAQMCGDKKTVEELNYRVENDGTIYQEVVDDDGKNVWKSFSKLGIRRAVLNDLSPAATFIAYNYNTPVDVIDFENETQRILKEVNKECGWMYETLHIDGVTKGRINYTVWSDVFVCPECSKEVVFWQAALDKNEENKVCDSFSCPYCSTKLSKRNMDHAWLNKYDSSIGRNIRQAKQVPVLINYIVNGKHFEKLPDKLDLNLIEKIDNSAIPYWYPTTELPDGFNTRQPKISHGLTHAHHFYTKRNLWVLSAIFNRCGLRSKLLFQSVATTLCSRLVRYNMGKRGNGPLNGTLYVSSLNAEAEVLKVFSGKSKDFIKAIKCTTKLVSQQQSFTDLRLPDNCMDYLFIDPPFGSNINYSELNFLWESWLKVCTNNTEEAIENSIQGKNLCDYRHLMVRCFKEAYRVLKAGRWMTVEFSNTKASVWNSIQSALEEAGFIVSNVSFLDKIQGSFKAVTTPTAQKQDLIISAYKPNGGFEDRFDAEAQTEEGVWDFVRTHLKYLPVVKRQGSAMQIVSERDPRILFDQVVAYYIRKGFPVPISSGEFQQGLAERFCERDGMYFLNEQANAYDRAKLKAGQLQQLTLFVSDESSAIQWLNQLLKEKPQTFQDINPQFMQQLGGWSKNEAQLDLRELLNQNFLCYDGKGEVPSQIHAHLSTWYKELRNLSKDVPTLVAKARDRWYVPDPNKASDLEKLREKALLKEFEEYRNAGKKIKVFRIEAVRAGFKKAYQEKDYQTIVSVAEKLPQNIIDEDPKLLMFYDQAQTRLGI